MIPIFVLPDDVLLSIFDLCINTDVVQNIFPLAEEYAKRKIESWQKLVHVCRCWTSLVFGSPRRLDLQLVCTTNTPARDTLDVWSALPLTIRCRGYYYSYLITRVDNIIAVLERSDRVRQITLENVPSQCLELILAAMRKTFPELTSLDISSSRYSAIVLPDSFLGGSAPHLQSLWLDCLSFPGLPKLLLSATRLVTLRLDYIPHPGYISPEAMVTALSTLTNLRSLKLEFRSPRSYPDQASRRPPPPTRSVLPVLTYFWFKGVTEYLEDLVALIDTPRLDDLNIILFNQILFDTPQFIQFVSRAPRLKALEKARILFKADAASINLSSHTSGYRRLNVNVPCTRLDWQVSSLEQVCTSCLPPLSKLEDLYIHEAPYSHFSADNIENTHSQELIHPFVAVKNLYLTEEFAPRILPVLQELVGDRTTGLLPALRNIFLAGFEPGPTQEGIRQFVDARRFTGHTIAFSRWDRRKRFEKSIIDNTLSLGRRLCRPLFSFARGPHDGWMDSQSFGSRSPNFRSMTTLPPRRALRYCKGDQITVMPTKMRFTCALRVNGDSALLAMAR